MAENAVFTRGTDLFDLIGFLHHRANQAGELRKLASEDVFAEPDITKEARQWICKPLIRCCVEYGGREG